MLQVVEAEGENLPTGETALARTDGPVTRNKETHFIDWFMQGYIDTIIIKTLLISIALDLKLQDTN